ERLDTLRMERAAADVAADGDPDHHGTRPRTGAPPAQGGHLVAHLHVAGERVVAELDLDDGLEAADRHSLRDPDDARLGERGVHDASREAVAKPARDAEDAALGIGDVLAPHDDPGIALHLFAQAVVDGVHHRYGHSGDGRVRRLLGHGYLVRVDVVEYVGGTGLRRGARLVGRRGHFGLDPGAHLRDLLLGDRVAAQELELRVLER